MQRVVLYVVEYIFSDVGVVFQFVVQVHDGVIDGIDQTDLRMCCALQIRSKGIYIYIIIIIIIVVFSLQVAVRCS